MAFKILFKSQSQYLNFDLRFLESNQLTPVPYSIGCADRYLAKADKPMGSDFLTENEKNYQIPLPAQTLVVQDAHPIFYYMKEVPERYQRMSEICSNVFDRRLKLGTLLFSPGIYEAGSVKYLEHKRSGCGKKPIVKGALKRLQIGNYS